MHLPWERVHVVIILAKESSIQNYKKMLLLKNYFFFHCYSSRNKFHKDPVYRLIHGDKKKWKQIFMKQYFLSFSCSILWYSLFYFILLHIGNAGLDPQNLFHNSLVKITVMGTVETFCLLPS